jgi:diguanylate cyclase (GGDEF)-like protein
VQDGELEDTAPGAEPAPLVPGKRDRPTLTMLTGVATGRGYDLTADVCRLGRAAESEIWLDDEGVSRNHAEVRFDDKRPVLHDLDSRNGTYLNGARISEPTPLADGDKIGIGSSVLRFAWLDALDSEFHEQLLASALRDPLTNLLNKRYFLERLDSELRFADRHNTAVALLLLDLDHFKRINDTRGHRAGDAALIHVSTLVSRSVRDEDVVARFGGEELVVILRATPLERAMVLAERLRKRIERSPCPHDGHPIAVTVSIGVAATPATTTAELIDAADRAMYRAKRAGRNRVERAS